jgi:Cu2+-containing amine oxidase
MGIPIDIKHEIPEHGAAKFKKISDAPRHPLDPLSPAELEEAVRILAREKYLGDNVRIASTNMMEPAKSLVEKHLPGPFERKAVAVLLNRGKRAWTLIADAYGLTERERAEAPLKSRPGGALEAGASQADVDLAVMAAPAMGG